ncbi:Rne/Rng family ribonuclease [Rhizobium sp. TRM95796]|uniref:Rne/Rng family ribonuclease n=1 Tax=Rhizobium sp. TRM95796 TaxID=2979862 RepID=UPI0021E7000C|nr:ribonuclease E/G [Rhizobium sp. TRM95796]MCV3765177.1 ribonuclease E/G [Rhizobium sp. TRM95796]
MADKMLIDASHAEETRVVVVRGNRIEEFDFESQHKKQLRGNIYLAKVTRVEPSLQAAFVDYGGNRHGFLAFAEIHPDYYQIPLADRQALLRAEAEEHRRDDDFEPVGRAEPTSSAHEPAAGLEEAPQPDIESWQGRSFETQAAPAAEEAPAEVAVEAVDAAPAEEAAPALEAEAVEAPAEKPKRVRKPRAKKVKVEEAPVEAATEGEQPPADASEPSDDDKGSTPPAMPMVADVDSISEDARRRGGDDEDDDDDDDIDEKEVIESVGAEDAMEEVPDRVVRKPRKQYRIQEVIKRRQILLVQVAKEERGNKGAALTTYLSLAGRYSVLMPNTARGGGISRKITSPQDRKRLKEIARELEVPQGMGVILRTAGANRTKAEVKRDFEYLMRLWENVRTKTLESTAPCLVYEEGSLIKRSIRDLYNKDISEVIVSGEEGYREAKDFMKMLMPSHAKVVQPYRDIHPIFSRAGIEAQLDRMLQPQVTLKSGGYIIINQTEALVAIDVNSGRSTREHSIEDTALQTNLEAAEEVARQLRLRDLAGLVVIDFIDMEEKRNNRLVEKRLKDHLKNDRARIQVGRISHFGLLEMSRQRIRASVLESTMQVCPHCNGAGLVRSQSSVALHVLRGIEEFLLKSTTHDIIVKTPADTALYLLNQKRGTIVDYENRFGVSITVMAGDEGGAQHFMIERGEAVENPVKIEQLIHFPVEEEEDEEIVEIEDEEDDIEESAAPAAPQQARSDDQSNKKKKRRRRRRGGKRDGADNNGANGSDDNGDESGDDDDDASEADDANGSAEEVEGADASSADAASESDSRKRRRRGKRGGRRMREGDVNGSSETNDADGEAADGSETQDAAPENAAEPSATEAPAPRPRRARANRAEAAAAPQAVEAVVVEAAAEEAAEPVVASEPDVPSEPAASTVAETTTESEPAPATEPEDDASADDKKVRSNRGEAALQASQPVVVSSSGPEKTEDDGKPKKGGWWQKRGFL